MKPKWQDRAWAIHQEYVKRAREKGSLTSEAECINFLALAICGEAGELGNCIKKMGRGDSVPSKDLRHEIADIRIYLNQLATHLEIDIDEACEEKLDIVAKRLKPVA
jgi:NTP pyrophosphatase (non-canonical NTP hydrolase)